MGLLEVSGLPPYMLASSHSNAEQYLPFLGAAALGAEMKER